MCQLDICGHGRRGNVRSLSWLMVGAIGVEFWGRRIFNNIERTAGTVKQWKAVVGSANGSQTDHGSVII
jgi:hypothetical protein